MAATTADGDVDDPFAAFGHDGDEDDDEESDRDDAFAVGGGGSKTPTTMTAAAAGRVLRDASCGAMVFHEGTERALLQHLKNGFSDDDDDQKKDADADCDNDDCDDDETASRRRRRIGLRRCDRIVDLADEFCMTRHWMMHVGNQKGEIVQQFLKEAVEERVLRQRRQYRQQPQEVKNDVGSGNDSSQPRPFLILELGTYCGYSIVRMARTILAHWCDADAEQQLRQWRIVSVDVNPRYVDVAKELVRLAGLEDRVSFVLLDGSGNGVGNGAGELSERVRAELKLRFPMSTTAHTRFDFVFVDHAKDLYASDVAQLERARLVGAGTRVCADNVVVFGLDEYRRHVSGLAARGVVDRTRLTLADLEYVTEETRRREGQDADDLRDGLGTC